jgi:multidrug efflux pump subunit AcrA (membrane-fusion protein)
LRKGRVILPDEVFITIVALRPLTVRASLEEKDLAALSQPAELKGTVTPAFDPDRRLPGRLTSILAVPREAGKFEAMVAVEPGEDLAALKPSMSCSIRFVPYRTNDALTVPSSAVFEEDSEDPPAAHYVYLAKLGKDARYPRQRVTIGRTSNRRTEITSGLSEGDEVLTSKP